MPNFGQTPEGSALAGVAPTIRQTVHTYNHGTELTFTGEDVDLSAGPQALLPLIDGDTALVIVQYPISSGVFTITRPG